MTPVTSPSAKTEVYYPDSDGKPLGETPLHVLNLFYLRDPLDTWFADDPNTFVAANMFVYYVEGDPHKHVSPDVFVVRGVPKLPAPPRRSYKVWQEGGKVPDVAIELTSASTRKEDVTDKMALYERKLGVREYFLFDPYAEYLDPPLQGYRLRKGKYERIHPVEGRLPSEVLGLHLEVVGELLRLYDPKGKKLLPIPPEIRQAWHEAEAARAREEQERQEAEAARKREEKARKREEKARKKEEEARKREEEAHKREEEARKQAEAEVERLRREVEELRRRLAGPSS
jgi:Uma2 family endonuclease